MIASVTYCAFVAHLGVQLTPGQAVLCGVLFDGLEPGDFEGEARELARTIFGDIDTIPSECREIVVAILGARSGKSYLLVALYSLWRAFVADLAGLAPGELAVALICGPDLRLARQALRFAIGAAESCPDLAPLVTAKSTDFVEITRPDGRTVRVECLPATARGSAVRGRSLVSACLDESCFFRDTEAVINDADIFEAVAPRVIPGGQVVIASTPWAQLGLTWDMWFANWGHPVAALAAHAPTLVLRDDPRTRRQIDRETERDSDNAEREFGARFLGAGTAQFFDAVTVDHDRAPVFGFEKGVSVSVGGDIGLVNDSSAIVAVHRKPDRSIYVAEILELRPKRGEPLKLSEVVASFCEFAGRHNQKRIWVDHHVLEPAREHLPKNQGFALVPVDGGQGPKADRFVRAKNTIKEPGVAIPGTYGKLASQLRDVVARPAPAGGLIISQPRRGGAHGDIASAFVLAIAPLAANKHKPPPAWTFEDFLGYQAAAREWGSRWSNLMFEQETRSSTPWVTHWRPVHWPEFQRRLKAAIERGEHFY